MEGDRHDAQSADGYTCPCGMAFDPDLACVVATGQRCRTGIRTRPAEVKIVLETTMCLRFQLPFLVCLSLAAMPIRLAAFSDSATATPVAADAPVQVTVWTWLIKIQNVNYPANELTVDMFVTFTYDLRFKDKINPMKHFEIVEAKSVTICEAGRKVSTGARRVLPDVPMHSRHRAPVGYPFVPFRPPQDPCQH